MGKHHLWHPRNTCRSFLGVLYTTKWLRQKMCGGTVPKIHWFIRIFNIKVICHYVMVFLGYIFNFKKHYRIEKILGVCVLSKNHWLVITLIYIMNYTYPTWIFHYTEMGKSLGIKHMFSLQLSTDFSQTREPNCKSCYDMIISFRNTLW